MFYVTVHHFLARGSKQKVQLAPPTEIFCWRTYLAMLNEVLLKISHRHVFTTAKPVLVYSPLFNCVIKYQYHQTIFWPFLFNIGRLATSFHSLRDNNNEQSPKYCGKRNSSCVSCVGLSV